MNVYLDNAATTPMAPAVLEAMLPYMNTLCGSPSSVHHYGRQAKVAVENARKEVAELLGVSPAAIFFTASGTEGNNMVLRGNIAAAGIQHVITSPLEHHAVLHPMAHMAKSGQIQLHYVPVDTRGNLQYDQLEALLKKYDQVLVSLMHANNEIGNFNDLTHIGSLCEKYDAYFHTDAVQTIGHCVLDLQSLPVHFAVGAAHKFHGPKGVGLVYIQEGAPIAPLLYGGAQERNMRAGTEDVANIVGLSCALKLAHAHMEADRNYIQQLKDHMIHQLRAHIPGIAFNGTSEDSDNSLYTILSISLPPADGHDMLVFKLDIRKVAVSVGSACASGSNVGSHVLEALGVDQRRGTVRCSFSKYNTMCEIDYVVQQLVALSNA